MINLLRLLVWVGLIIAPTVAAQDPEARLPDVPAGLSISSAGGLPSFLDDDVRLQWTVPGDDAATNAYRELEYAVVEAEVGEGLRRTLIARQLIGGRRLVHHYFLSADGSLPANGILRMDLDFPADAALEMVGERGFVPESLPGFGAAYGDVRMVAVGPEGQRWLEADEAGVSESDIAAANWFGVRNRFWTALIRVNAVPLTVEFSAEQTNLPRLLVRAPPDDLRVTFELYAGPVEIETLRDADPVLENMLFAALWGWLGALCFGLLWILSILISLVGNVGMAIILLSVCVKILMSPLTLIAERLQDSVNRTQAELQPQFDAIKKEFKGEEAHNRILDVYKAHDVHPLYAMKSLFGFMIQIPIFIAAFDMLGENFALNQAGFLWIDDLAKPDRWVALPWTLPFFGGHLNLLPALMTGVTILTSWLQTDASLTPELLHRQRRRLYLMAGAFFFLFYTFPAGMVLYWTTNNVLHLVKILAGRLIAGFRKT